MSQEVFVRRITAEGEPYLERLSRRVPCPECGLEMTSMSLTSHRQHLHGTKPKIEWYRLPVIHHEHLPQIYEVRLLCSIIKYQCPFLGFPELSRSRSGIHNHPNQMHWQDIIQKLEEHPSPYPHYKRCGQQVPRGSCTTDNITYIRAA